MIYLDHAAATPVTPKVLQAMTPYFSRDFFNPSSPYLPAKHVREAYNSAKNTIANAIGAKGNDLIITAGATESINLAFTAIPANLKDSTTVLTLSTEHPAVLAAAKQFSHKLIKVDHTGLINLPDFKAKLTDDVIFISIALANNELGTIQPLSEIAEIVRQTRQDRYKRGISTPLYLHSDASQALNLLDINVARLGIDLLTISAAKCGGPKGIGALYASHNLQLHPLIHGGGQEQGLRSGTENVPGVIGFATAVSEAKKHLAGNRKKYTSLKLTLKSALSELDSIIFLGNPKHQLANFLPISLPGLDAERLIYKLEQQEIYLSTGAACAANKGSKSHVLTAIGLSDEEISGSLRISLGSTNTPDQIIKAADIIKQTIIQEYARIGLANIYQDRLKEQLASCEEGEPCEDRRSTGSIETNISKTNTRRIL